MHESQVQSETHRRAAACCRAIGWNNGSPQRPEPKYHQHQDSILYMCNVNSRAPSALLAPTLLLHGWPHNLSRIDHCGNTLFCFVADASAAH